MKKLVLPIHSSPPKKTNNPILGNLKLEGNKPVSVWVDIFPGDVPEEPVVGFAASVDGPYYSDVEWIRKVISDDDDNYYGKFITFHLSPRAIGMDCDLAYSERYDVAADGTSKIKMCIPAMTWQVTYHFGVEPAGVTLQGKQVTLIDPKIIVTPIGANF